MFREQEVKQNPLEQRVASLLYAMIGTAGALSPEAREKHATALSLILSSVGPSSAAVSIVEGIVVEGTRF